jgi:hypothetical protein
MYNYCPVNDLIYTELICEECHSGITVIGEKNRKVSCVIAMGLIRGIPVPSCKGKRLCRIPCGTIARFMNMKAMWSYRRVSVRSRFIGRQPVNLYSDLSPACDFGKCDRASYFGMGWTSCNISHCSTILYLLVCILCVSVKLVTIIRVPILLKIHNGLLIE